MRLWGKRSDAQKWREWANWILSLKGQQAVPGATAFHAGEPAYSGTVEERALYAYFLAEAGEPF